MTTLPQVTVVMSVFNGERYLQASMDSILAQQGVVFEILVVDDGSTDTTATILAGYARQDPRVHVLSQENSGLTRALIRGCNAARGEFIARQDVDDVSLPGRLARQAAMLSADQSLAMASCAVGSVGPAGELLFDSSGPSDPAEATTDLLDNHRGPVHGSVMFRRSAYEKTGGYRSEFYFAQDSDLWLRLGEVGGITYLPERFYLLRISEHALGARWGAAQARLGRLSHDCQQARRDGRSEAAALREAQRIRPALLPAENGDPKGADGLWFLSRCLLRKRDRRGLKYALRYIACRPGDPKGWLSAAWGFVSAWSRGDTATALDGTR